MKSSAIKWNALSAVLLTMVACNTSAWGDVSAVERAANWLLRHHEVYAFFDPSTEPPKIEWLRAPPDGVREHLEALILRDIQAMPNKQRNHRKGLFCANLSGLKFLQLMSLNGKVEVNRVELDYCMLKEAMLRLYQRRRDSEVHKSNTMRTPSHSQRLSVGGVVSGV